MSDIKTWLQFQEEEHADDVVQVLGYKWGSDEYCDIVQVLGMDNKKKSWKNMDCGGCSSNNGSMLNKTCSQLPITEPVHATCCGCKPNVAYVLGKNGRRY